jgi:farnesyl-diphosphate farnesyltransferase
LTRELRYKRAAMEEEQTQHESHARKLTISDIDELLVRTSRTFALAIPLLEDPAATMVGLAYLLFRIADTLEDAPRWGRERRARALASFAAWLHADVEATSGGAADPAEWKRLAASDPPTDDAGCIELLGRADEVLAAVHSGRARAADAIILATHRTALGMAEFVARQNDGGCLVLTDLADLQRYAYVVAGIVGELLTQLFAMHDVQVASIAERLAEDAAAFGEGLQLVNILKDAAADEAEGRRYLPPGTPRASVVDLARRDLARAGRYLAALEEAGATTGIVRFCELPLRLAEATLVRLDGGGIKLGRDEVLAIYASVTSRGRAVA